MPAYTEDQLAVRLLADLEPVVTGEINRHITMARDWYPHEYVPWSEGRTFGGVLEGEAWEPTEQRFSDAARAALIVNLLTEDNLPATTSRSPVSSPAKAPGASGCTAGRLRKAATRRSSATT